MNTNKIYYMFNYSGNISCRLQLYNPRKANLIVYIQSCFFYICCNKLLYFVDFYGVLVATIRPSKFLCFFVCFHASNMEWLSSHIFLKVSLLLLYLLMQHCHAFWAKTTTMQLRPLFCKSILGFEKCTVSYFWNISFSFPSAWSDLFFSKYSRAKC